MLRSLATAHNAYNRELIRDGAAGVRRIDRCIASYDERFRSGVSGLRRTRLTHRPFICVMAA
jgi:hypothetical protein